ncbi:MAG TPA: class II fumarate hydratase [Candidatus Bathyarchaeia archaeon]|nr:class II fumarate hydratase [Candidatus Bathyarchaeia archaeon]
MVTVEDYRVEKDSMGEVKVPSSVYYGAETQRAVDNFPISGLRFPREFIRALAVIKFSAAKANMQLGILDRKKGEAIVSAAKEIMEGALYDQFAVDVFQTGSGTSTNMNMNEVIANRADELLGGRRGDRSLVHPNDHVNMCQSTNDVFPSAIHVSSVEAIGRRLLPGLRTLATALEQKVKEFEDTVKAGRTHLQDAVPIMVGQEFSGYLSMIRHGIIRAEHARDTLLELPLGGTAVGTGLNAHPKYAELAIAEINRLTGFAFRKADNTFEAMQGKDGCVEASGLLKTIATSLMKISNDLRLLNSGPRTAIGEIDLPAMEPGSSIMPGKVNPVIPEALGLIAAKVYGNDTSIGICGSLGQLELNTMMPVIAYDLLQSIEILANGSRILGEKCVAGIAVDKKRCLEYAERTLMMVTRLTPIIGYDNATKIAKKAMAENKSLRQVVLEQGILPKEKLDEVLDLKKMTKGGRA